MRPLTLLAVIFFAALAAPAGAQTLPNHVDPSAREDMPDLSGLAAIRFLTTADFPPFNYRDGTGELVGFNIDLARALCATLSVACTVQAWPWEQAADALADNQGDALIAGLALTPETGTRFDFSSVYLAFPGRFVAPRDDVAGFDALALDGKGLAVRAGTSHATLAEAHARGARILPFATEIDALEAVRAGDADLFFGDAMRAAFWLNERGNCCGFAGAAYFRPDLFGPGLAIAVPAGRDLIREAIDYGLVRLARAGTLDELYLRWFPIGFY